MKWKGMYTVTAGAIITLLLPKCGSLDSSGKKVKGRVGLRRVVLAFSEC